MAEKPWKRSPLPDQPSQTYYMCLYVCVGGGQLGLASMDSKHGMQVYASLCCLCYSVFFPILTLFCIHYYI